MLPRDIMYATMSKTVYAVIDIIRYQQLQLTPWLSPTKSHNNTLLRLSDWMFWSLFFGEFLSAIILVS